MIIFAHGLLWDHRLFDAQVAALKDHYRCITFDFRGQGRSEVTALGYDMEVSVPTSRRNALTAADNLLRASSATPEQVGKVDRRTSTNQRGISCSSRVATVNARYSSVPRVSLERTQHDSENLSYP